MRDEIDTTEVGAAILGTATDIGATVTGPVAKTVEPGTVTSGAGVPTAATMAAAPTGDGVGLLPPLGVGVASVPIGLPMVILAPEKITERVPEAPVSRAPLSESFRAGYPEYLRSARMGEVAGLAVPGIAGILALTVAGSSVG
jgi:hypothetical protein